jgi:hypothetical protein
MLGEVVDGRVADIELDRVVELLEIDQIETTIGRGRNQR